MNPIGPLLPQDEGFCHQIADTFAVVGSTDLAWTEKVCAMAAARDGSLQLGFGLGKYTNRNVMDGYSGISRGVEQITIRASRRLEPEPDLTVIGPIRYEVVEPLRKVRFVLEPNDRQPIAFNWLFEAAVPPHMEERNHLRTHYRVASELVRYHQTGVCSGWVEVDGRRTEMTPETWVTTRDHSWGVRYDVGKPMTDVHVADPFRGGTYEFLWSPVLMQRGDGTRYALFLSYGIFAAPGFSQRTINGGIEHPDGRFEKFADIAPSVQYDPRNRRLRKGHLDCTLLDGTRRRIEIEAISETGFHLGAGLYFGFDGHHHGEWRGDLHVDGERIEDCSTPENARRLHQIRDTVIFVRDPVGGGEGVGNAQAIIIGAHPERGLTADSSFM